MARYILLDSAPLNLSAIRAEIPEAHDISEWVANCDSAGHFVIVPEIIDYEVRRELVRARKWASVAELDYLKTSLNYLPLTTGAMLKAADPWALTRQNGRPTAHDQNIDVDVILASQALTLGVPVSDLCVATSNPRHLSLFVPADLWSNLKP